MVGWLGGVSQRNEVVARYSVFVVDGEKLGTLGKTISQMIKCLVRDKIEFSVRVSALFGTNCPDPQNE